MALTPLLASAACGIFDFQIAEEPVRRFGNAGRVQKYQVHVQDVDLEGQIVRCRAEVGSNGDARVVGEEGGEGEGEFELDYDKLILAPGSETNTFGTPGVLEHLPHDEVCSGCNEAP
jgi:NADH:quinone reductase (non-electrogenic)